MQQPEYQTVKQTMKAVPCGMTKVYQLISEERLEAVKLGRRTLIKTASIDRLHKSLPKLETPTLARHKTEAEQAKLKGTAENNSAHSGLAQAEIATGVERGEGPASFNTDAAIAAAQQQLERQSKDKN
jgi:excisionase family DNA binding protein